MGEDASELREEIEEARGRMGETVDAIAYKADVPARARNAITGTIGNLREARDRARNAAGAVRENPLGILAGAAVAGMVIGLLLPMTELERKRLGPIGEQVRERARQRVKEAISRVMSPS